MKHFLTAGLAAMMVGGASAKDQRPNIVVIMTDDSGFSDIGCFGGEIDTPNLDKLATQGIRLNNFYNNGRCSPTRASLLTGLDCGKVGFGGGVVGDWSREMPYQAHRGRLPYDTPLISELMKEAGYKTLMSGKWHMGGSLMKFSKGAQKTWQQYHPGWKLTEEEMEQDFLALPKQRGFDEYFGLYGAQDSMFWVPGQKHPIMEGNDFADLNYDREYTMHCWSPRKDMNYNVNHGKVGKAFYDTDGVTDRAIEMIQDASGPEADPFFLYVAYRAPHKPLQAPEELVQKYLKKYENIRDVETARVTKLKAQGIIPHDLEYKPVWIKPPEEDFRLQMALHGAMMEVVDQNVGRLMDTLRATGELDNTLVMFLSDNGSAAHLNGIFNTPYQGVKALLWEGGTRTHFIASWPGKIEPGSFSREQAWVGDIVPTCLKLAGTEYPKEFRGKVTEELPGRDLMPVLMGEKRAPAKAIFFNDKGQQSVIYQGRWKLLIEAGWYLETREKEGIAYELYDIKNDPTEMKNLANENPELVQKLAKMCEEWIIENEITDYAELIKLRPNDPY